MKWLRLRQQHVQAVQIAAAVVIIIISGPIIRKKMDNRKELHLVSMILQQEILQMISTGLIFKI